MKGYVFVIQPEVRSGILAKQKTSSSCANGIRLCRRQNVAAMRRIVSLLQVRQEQNFSTN